MQEISRFMLRAKVLFARADKIGDLILTLPMETAWKKQHQNTEVTWLVERQLKFVMEALPHRPQVFYIQKVKNIFSQILELKKLISFLKKENFNTVFGIQVPWWVAFAFWWVQIPIRVGVASKWYSWIFYNKKVRQHRSLAVKSEAEYNLDLIRSFEPQHRFNLEPINFELNSQKLEQWRAVLGEGFTLIHPGMAGSARNWPLEKYSDLARELIKKGSRVLVTGSKQDRDIVEKTGILNINGVENYLEKTAAEDLLYVISLAGTIVAPSTGVAHLGASLGKKVVGIYSPVRVQASLRWGPIGKNVKVFSPQVECPGTFKCLGSTCEKFDCMSKIEVDSIAQTVMEQKV